MQTVVTHNGSFHADDVFGVATLKMHVGEPLKIRRSRDQDEIDAADYAVDVGEEYDPSRDRFDHHQEGGAGKRNNGIPYAAFGLVWKKHGPAVCGSQEIADIVDSKLAQPIDAIDNGVPLHEGESRVDGVYPYTIASMVAAFRPTWQEPESDSDVLFDSLVKLATGVIDRERAHGQAAMAATSEVEKAYHQANDERLVILDKDLPWRNVLCGKPEPLLVVYPKPERGEWCVKAVPDDGFDNRIDLPQHWAGKSGQELERATGVGGSVFAHRAQFMAVAETKDQAKQLARQALKNAEG
jgi:uncharacterized UPF0160 family protein